MSKMLKSVLTVFTVILLVACAQAQITPMPSPQPTSANSGPGTPMWEVGQIKDLPSDLIWAKIGSTTNPTKFSYQVSGEKVEAKIFWADKDTVEIHVSNHDRVPCFYTATFSRGWIVTDGYFATAWLTDRVNQFGMVGFKGEVRFYFIFKGNILEVAFAQ